MAYVRDVDSAAFGQEVLQRSHEVPIVVDFWAEWCGPCKTLSPILERLAMEYAGAFELVKVDVDRNQELAAQFGIQGIPTVIAFHGGQAASRFTGALPDSAVREWIDRILPTELDHKLDEARDAVLNGNEEAAEALFAEILAEVPDHPDAGTGLASLLIAKGRTDEALVILGRLPRSSEVERLESAARVAASQGTDVAALEAKLEEDLQNSRARLELGLALAAKAEYEPALDHLLKVVKAGDEVRDEARRAMIDIFGVLGDGHPLTTTYRRQLANALF
ncbi:MAG: thioredoxin [Acidimicrobiia bacterium]